MPRIKVTRVFFYDAVPSIGSNCLPEGEWDSELGVIFHTTKDGKRRACSVTMVREMTVADEVPVVLAAPAAPDAVLVRAQSTEVAKVAKVDPVPDPATGVVRRKRA